MIRTPKSALTPTSRRGATPRTPRSGSKQLLVTPNKEHGFNIY